MPIPLVVNLDGTAPLQADRFQHVVRSFTAWIQSVHLTRPRGNFRWSPDELSEILIGGTEMIDGPASNQLPRIIVWHTGGTNMGVATAQTQVFPFGIQQERLFTDIVSSKLIIETIAPVSQEAQDIAFMLFSIYPLFREELHRFADLHNLDARSSLSPPQPYNGPLRGASGSAWKSVQLGIPFSFQNSVKAGPNGMASYIRGISQTMVTLLGTP